ncbi:MAG: sensor histidine kinase, partial [Verrucomicrobiales bacterium]|nr:sensor histidine kinase [Verrucomicrobiales bacterium]
ATQLEQAFLNLILNAVEAMPQGGKLTVTTRAIYTEESSPKPLEIVIEIKDTGQGMTEEQKLRAFSSLLSTTKAKGTGLGLAIVSRVVEVHRGKVAVKSKPDAGTTMIITLPV